MKLEVALAFFVTEFLLSLVPGPAVLFVVASTMARGATSGAVAAAGVLIGNLIYFAISATTLGALITGSMPLYVTIEVIGALYLCFLAYRMITANASGASLDPGGSERSGGGHAATFATATMLQLANPKMIVFFAAIVPQFVDQSQSIIYQMIWLAIASITAEAIVFAMYIYFTQKLVALFGSQSMTRYLNIMGGIVLFVIASITLYNRIRAFF